MAVCAEDPLLRHGVMAGQGKFGLYLLMTFITHLCGIPRPHRQVRTPAFKSAADAVTVHTRYIAHSMDACIPVMEIKGRICSMAFKAYKGLRLGRNVLYIYESLVITCSLPPFLCLHFDLFRSYTLHSKASRSMTRLTIYKGHT